MSSSLYEIVITAVVVKKGKYLIMQRTANKKRFPLQWTIPGGHLENEDFMNRPKDSADYWYNILETTLTREVKEEAGIDIKNVEYITSLATVYADGRPSLVLTCSADYHKGKVKLQSTECQDYAWVSLREAKKYDLIDGIYDELAMTEAKRKGKRVVWRRNS
jgi:8-oxo-dGTP pyrophosphatase MutT (NUDIX family)